MAHARMLGAARHHCTGRRRCHPERAGTRSPPKSPRARFVFKPRIGRHPSQYRGAPGRADRAGGGAASHRALAQRPGGDRFPDCGCARRARGRATRLVDLQRALLTQAEAHAATIMPGFTHMQPAQPVTFGHHCLAYVEMFSRDRGRFADAAKRMNESPLGAAALAGTSFAIDRDATAKELGFFGADAQFARCGERAAISRWNICPPRRSHRCICRGSPKRSCCGPRPLSAS